MRFLFLCCVLLALAAPGAAQSSNTLVLSLGEPVEHLAAATDTTQHYALYLPSDYAREQAHPVLFLMDPRGQAMRPLKLFRDAAERHGYVVMSSYETLSDADSATAVNARALTAMIQDAQVRFNVDTRRLYLVGFSGTAHYAWATAAGFDGHLAGIVGVGGGLPPYSKAVRQATQMERPMAFIGVAGTGDFNYDGVRLLDQALDTTRVPHRFVSHKGIHSWPPKAIAEEAVDWLQLQAMRGGLAPSDDRWIDSLRAAHLAQARALEQAGRLAGAMRRYREVAADFEGLEGAAEARQRVDELAQNETVQRTLARWDALARRVHLYKQSSRTFAEEYRSAEAPIPHPEALRRLQVPSLKREASNPVDEEEADAARRMLASAYALTGFYEPRDYFQQEDYAKAAGMLRLAREIQPDLPYACYRLARAEAQLRHTEEALEALTCAVEGQGVRRDALEHDPLLEPLHQEDRFWELVARLPDAP